MSFVRTQIPSSLALLVATGTAVAGSWDVSDLKPPECVDRKADTDKILAAARNSGSQDEFLKAIGPSSLRGMTFLTSSDNPEFAPGISAEWPGPVRFSLDGRIMMRYSCDRKSSAYGKVDLFVREGIPPVTRTFSINFRKPGKHRIDSDPAKCAGCHGGTGSTPFHPIWEGYPKWPNAIGSPNDILSPEADEDTGNPSIYAKRRQLEREALANVKRKLFAGSGRNPDPCYDTLPWADSASREPASVWPYRTDNDRSDMSARPNALMTDLLARPGLAMVAAEVAKDPKIQDLLNLRMFAESLEISLAVSQEYPRRACAGPRGRELGPRLMKLQSSVMSWLEIQHPTPGTPPAHYDLEDGDGTTLERRSERVRFGIMKALQMRVEKLEGLKHLPVPFKTDVPPSEMNYGVGANSPSNFAMAKVLRAQAKKPPYDELIRAGVLKPYDVSSVLYGNGNIACAITADQVNSAPKAMDCDLLEKWIKLVEGTVGGTSTGPAQGTGEGAAGAR